MGGLYHCWIKFAAAPARALKLYHVTTVPIAKDIKAHGFKPVDQGMWKNYYAPQGRDGIYFYDDLKYSEAYAAYAEGQLFTRNMKPENSWEENKKSIPQIVSVSAACQFGAVHYDLPHTTIHRAKVRNGVCLSQRIFLGRERYARSTIFKNEPTGSWPA